MKKYFILLVLLLSLASCSNLSTEDSLINVNLEIPFELKVGQTADIEDHKFTFKEVSSDSRCPVDTQCIWTGEATIVLVSEDNEGDLAEINLNMTDSQMLFPQTYIEETCNGDVCTFVDPPYGLGYAISLVSLTPNQQVGIEIVPSDYVATLTISLTL